MKQCIFFLSFLTFLLTGCGKPSLEKFEGVYSDVVAQESSDGESMMGTTITLKYDAGILKAYWQETQGVQLDAVIASVEIKNQQITITMKSDSGGSLYSPAVISGVISDSGIVGTYTPSDPSYGGTVQISLKKVSVAGQPIADPKLATTHTVDENTNDSSSDTIMEPVAVDVNPDNLTIKGLYVGMPKEECLSLIKDKHSTEIGKITSSDDENIYCENGTFKFKVGENTLASFTLKKTAVDALFNVADLNNEQFAQTFIDSYKIPNVSETTSSEIYSGSEPDPYYTYSNFLKCTSASGWELVITLREIRSSRMVLYKNIRSISVTEVPKSTERVFD